MPKCVCGDGELSKKYGFHYPGYADEFEWVCRRCGRVYRPSWDRPGVVEQFCTDARVTEYGFTPPHREDGEPRIYSWTPMLYRIGDDCELVEVERD